MKLSLYILSLSTVVFAQSLAPSPTESVGCEAHEDHWHCDGPVSTTQAESSITTTFATTTTATSTSSEEDHDHESGTGSLAPSPTESVGCEPHGDHWHCDGPASTTAASNATSSSTASTTSSTTATTTPATAGASRVALGGAFLFAGLVFCASM
ncbi:hypothetical protein PFICI_13885 [Pestalotiopsis fici W106-1]|uniref:Uncharacterized protein n=1 Tax=Pestalotiopsis fici (strain W106-1 / CGMCC3.15140) TaxID=1229662 RepID=W3WJS2_PESFW|nr:uncharacterized protein PFICI_13885 [Pestalotiopsis fici W106-1]ETS74019.1 hypothetical protein PFICI_13885 [Pestalotiopsis fici W106-1]